MVPIAGSPRALTEWEDGQWEAYRAILAASGDVVLTADWATARFVDANEAALERLGYGRNELSEMTGGDLSQFPRDEHRRISEELIARGHTHAPSIPVRCRDGRLLIMDMWARRFEAGSRSFHVTVLRDAGAAAVPDAKFETDVDRIRESEAFYRGVVTCTEDAVVVTDMDSGETIEANPAACSLFGYSTVGWGSVSRGALFPDRRSLQAVDRELDEQGRARRAETPMLRSDGSTFVADTMHNLFETGGRRLIVMLVRDATDRRQQRLRFERAQRLAAVGEVAAGVAHEINNPAAFAILNCRAVAEQLKVAKAQLERVEVTGVAPAVRLAEEALADTLAGLERIVSAARDLRQFWRVDEREVVQVDVNGVVRATLNRLRNETRHRARVELDLMEGLPRLAMQDGKLDQVLTNLILNAAQSIVEGDAHANEIRVHTTRVGASVRLAVSDTGHGMDESTLGRVFEPFFSTKSADEGAGLGLALSSEIITAHRGSIRVNSTLGVGTRFEVELPLDTGLAPLPGPATPVMPRGKRVLVVDDDPGMVRAYRRLLRDRAAVVVNSGRKALELLDADPDFDVIVCDLMMPDVDGPALYRVLLDKAPHLAARMVFCTGGAITARTREFVASIDNEVLDKPLRTSDLDRLFAIAPL